MKRDAAKKTSAEAADEVAALLAVHILRAPQKRLARLTAVLLVGRVFTNTRVAAKDRKALEHTIGLVLEDDPAAAENYRLLNAAAQTDFWRSLALHYVNRLDKVPADRHTEFWSAVALAAARYLDEVEKKPSRTLMMVEGGREP